MHKCIVCGADLGEESHLMLLPDMPSSAQDIPSAEELAEDRGMDLQLCQCPCCGLVQFDCEPVSYYRDVIRSGGYSSTMAELRRIQYRRFIELCGLEGKRIIEIGCGQGEFLKILTEFPVRAYGIEHKSDLVEKAQDTGLEVWQGFAENAETALKGAPYDAFLSFNFLEHQPRPNDMLRCIYNNLSGDGVGLITVPSLEYIVANNGYYELLRDHIANYSEETLRHLLNHNGFMVLESAVVNRDTLSMIVKKRPRLEIGGLKRNCTLLARHLRQYMDERVKQGRKIAVWGASHQGFTTLSTTGIGKQVDYIIDSAPFKQGRFAPASHVPIVAPEHFFAHPVDSILIIAPGYTDEIASIIRERFGTHIEIAAIRAEDVEILPTAFVEGEKS